MITLRYWEYLANIKEKETGINYSRSDIKEVIKDELILMKDQYLLSGYRIHFFKGIEYFNYTGRITFNKDDVSQYLGKSTALGYILASNELIRIASKKIKIEYDKLLHFILTHEQGHMMEKYNTTRPTIDDILDSTCLKGKQSEIIADKFAITFSGLSKNDYIKIRMGLRDLLLDQGYSSSNNYLYNYEKLYDTKDKPFDYQIVLD